MDTVLDSIGRTPLVELTHVVPGGCARCVAKPEGQNPMCDSGLKYLSTELYRTG